MESVETVTPRWRPAVHEILYLAFVLTLPLGRPSVFRAGGLRVPMADVIFFFAFAFFCLSILRHRQRLVSDRFLVVLGLWVAALALSTATSEEVGHSAVKLVGELYLVCIAFMTFHVIRSLDALRRLTKYWLAGTLLTVLAGLAGIVSFYLGFDNPRQNPFLTGWGSVPPGPWPRVAGFFLYPNMTINYLSVSLSIAVLATFAGWIPRKTGTALLAGIVIVQFFTLSPCFGGVALAIGLWAWWWWKSRNRAVAVTSLVLGVLAAAVFLLLTVVSALNDHPEGFDLPLTSKRGVVSHRFEAWTTAAETWTRHPVFGRGLGLEVSAAYYVNPSGGEELLTDAHNLWFSIAGQMGTVGVAAMMILVVFLMRRLKGWRPQSTAGGLIVAAFTIAMIDAFFYQGISGSFENARHLWVLFGLIAATVAMES